MKHLGLEVVLMGGEVVRLGGKHFDSAGLDLLGVMTGSEGLLGIVTEATVRILAVPECAVAFLAGFCSVESAARCVGDVIAAGIIPAGMEMMDGPAIRAAEAYIAAGYPTEAEAVVLIFHEYLDLRLNLVFREAFVSVFGQNRERYLRFERSL